MHRYLWAYVAHSSLIEGSHTIKNTASCHHFVPARLPLNDVIFVSIGITNPPLLNIDGQHILFCRLRFRVRECCILRSCKRHLSCWIGNESVWVKVKHFLWKGQVLPLGFVWTYHLALRCVYTLKFAARFYSAFSHYHRTLGHLGQSGSRTKFWCVLMGKRV